MKSLYFTLLLSASACALPHAQNNPPDARGDSDQPDLTVVDRDVEVGADADVVSENVIDRDVPDELADGDVAIDSADVVDAADAMDASDASDVRDVRDVREADAPVDVPLDTSCPANQSYCDGICQTNLVTRCGASCAPCPGATVCRAGQCVTPVDCVDQASQRLYPSAEYLLDLDDNPMTPPEVMFCDMDTPANAGGAAQQWTVVFDSMGLNHVSSSRDGGVADAAGDVLPNWRMTRALGARSNRVLMAYRNETMGVLTYESAVLPPGSPVRPSTATAVFAIPNPWRMNNPFATDGTDHPLTSATINGVDVGARTLRYGNESFAGACETSWTRGVRWGRICIQDSESPYFASWMDAARDSCSGSTLTQRYNVAECSIGRRFTIAVTR